MKKMIEISNYFKKNQATLLISLIAISIPFGINVGSYIIAFATIFSLFLGLIKDRVFFKKLNSFVFWFPVIFFIIIFISAITSKNIVEGINQVNKRYLIVIIPFVIIIMSNMKFCIYKIMKTFSVSVIVATLVLIINNIIKIYLNKPIDDLFFHKFTSFYGQHPVYFSLYIVLSIFYLTDVLFKRDITYKTKKTNIILGLLILIVGLIFSESKAVIAIFIPLYTIQLVFSLKSFKKRLTTLFLIIISCLIFFNSPHIKERFLSGLKVDQKDKFTPTNNFKNVKIFNYNEKKEISDLELRYIFFKIGLYHTIYDNKWAFGYGIGDAQDNLDYYYMKYGLAPNWFEGYNLHNQYLDFFVSYGVFVLFFFIIYLGYSFHQALHNKYLLHILFLTLMTFVFIFEVFLTRNKGIIFFYFFNSLFLINYSKFENSNSRN